jgi:outer membrane protein
MAKARRLPLHFFFTVMLTGCFFAPDTEAKVGYIDLQRLVKESKMGVAARKEIEILRQQKEKAIFEKMQEIERLKSELAAEGDAWTENDKRDRLQQLQQANKEYQRMVSDAKEEIAREDRELVTDILKKAEAIITRVAKQQRYAIILKDPNVIGYLDPKVNITELVIKAMNAAQ